MVNGNGPAAWGKGFVRTLGESDVEATLEGFVKKADYLLMDSAEAASAASILQCTRMFLENRPYPTPLLFNFNWEDTVEAVCSKIVITAKGVSSQMFDLASLNPKVRGEILEEFKRLPMAWTSIGPPPKHTMLAKLRQILRMQMASTGRLDSRMSNRNAALSL
eukprot:GEMP01027750.1.p1 GENE.GEMP01027750.1~~GEMP01027750.1.p1  ORF type:complete len:163 (+),score=34.81 GEMP01027750.1:145-633(+)